MRATTKLTAIALTLSASVAFAGRGGSNAAIQDAIDSGSPDSIIAEVERAEVLACVSCISTVLPLVDHPSARVRNVAAWWLNKRGVREEVRDMALVRLQGNDPVLARNAAEVLGTFHHVEAIPALSAFVARPLDAVSGAAAADALGLIGSAQAVPGISVGLRSSLPAVRASSVKALRSLNGWLDGSAAVPLVSDSDESVRTQAIFTLGQLQDRSGVDAIVKCLQSDPSSSVRKHAAWALGAIGDARAASALQAAAQGDGDALVVGMAKAAIARMK